MDRLPIILSVLVIGVLLFGCTQTPSQAGQTQNQTPVQTQNTTYVSPSSLSFYTMDTLPDAYVGVLYNYSFCDPVPTNVNDLCGALQDANNPSLGNYPYHFTLGSGVGFQPLGLILNLNGLLTGIPTIAGTKTFQVCAVDLSANSVCNNVTLTVEPSYNVSIHFTGDGSGAVNVTWNDDINSTICNGDCSFSFINGTEFEISVTPDNGSAITGETGDITQGYGGYYGSSFDTINDSNEQVNIEFRKVSMTTDSMTCKYYTDSYTVGYKVTASGTVTGPNGTGLDFSPEFNCTTGCDVTNGFLNTVGDCGAWGGANTEYPYPPCDNNGSYGTAQWSFSYVFSGTYSGQSEHGSSEYPFTFYGDFSLTAPNALEQDIEIPIHCS